MLAKGTHTPCHGYTRGPWNYPLNEADCRVEKSDDDGNKVYWPEESVLEDGGEFKVAELQDEL